MSTLPAAGPNAQQIEYWNQTAGPKWVANQAVLDAQIAPLGEAAFARAAIAEGERVLDVGCGCGSTTLDLARRVGPSGRVLGIDISTVMLEAARAAARHAGLEHASFENADAQTHRFAPASFDVVTSRFGVMFFIEPVTAFANLRSALRPGGRLGFVCWQSMPQNPWMAVPLMAAAQLITLPTPPAPGAPGPFAFADRDRVRGILDAAGFADVEIEPFECKLRIGAGRDLAGIVDFLLQLGPLGNAIREAGPDAPARVAAAVRTAVEPYWSGDGVVLDSASWIVSGRNF